ncbi:MAG: glycosyltransferase family 2 protein [Acidimicrobiales bacterium]|nr:glycosyltransferase family 2 protein [Acidimicrobiales bacterium]
MSVWLTGWLPVVPWVLFFYVLLVLALQAMLYVSAVVELYRVRRRDRHRLWRRVLSSPLAPRVSVLVPAYNEELTIRDSVAGILALTYPNLEVVVVDDGSADGTIEQLIEAFDLVAVHPIYQRRVRSAEVLGIYRSRFEQRLVVVRKENGGKADALNCGLNVATGELVCAIDADTLVTPDALQQLVAPFLGDEEVAAVGGTVRVVNDAEVRAGFVVTPRAPRGFLATCQSIEYTRAFLVGRLGWNPLGGNLIVSGAFGVFRRDRVVDIGGYEHASVGEDMELVVRLRRRAYEERHRARVVFSPDPVAWTEAPESWRTLARQRNRWFRGLLDVLVRHRRMLFNPRYGSAGMLAMPYYLVVEALSPVVESLGLLLLAVGLMVGAVTPSMLMPVALGYLFGVLAAVFVLIFDDIVFRSYPGLYPRVKLGTYAFYEQLVFRPVTLVWRLWGLKLFVQGKRDWGRQVRKGFVAT